MLSSLLVVAAMTATHSTTSFELVCTQCLECYCPPCYPCYQYAPPCYSHYPALYIQLPYLVPAFPFEEMPSAKDGKDKKDRKDKEDPAGKLEKKMDALGDLLLNFEKRLTTLEKRLEKLEKGSKPAPDARQELGNRALVTVRLPADATLFLDGRPTRGNNQPVRSILTPELEQGAGYSYELRVEVMRDGRRISETRRVGFQAGRTTEVSFELPTNDVARR